MAAHYDNVRRIPNADFKRQTLQLALETNVFKKNSRHVRRGASSRIASASEATATGAASVTDKLSSSLGVGVGASANDVVTAKDDLPVNRSGNDLNDSRHQYRSAEGLTIEDIENCIDWGDVYSVASYNGYIPIPELSNHYKEYLTRYGVLLSELAKRVDSLNIGVVELFAAAKRS